MRRLLIISLLLNSILAGCIGFMLIRLGGWRYALHRFWHNETGLYQHRKSLLERTPIRKGAVIMLGDSQTEQCEWAELMPDTMLVLNRGIVGDHVDGVFARLDKEVLRHKPSRIYLCIGVNDLLLEKPYEDIEKTYRAIVLETKKKAPRCKLYLVSLLPVNNKVKYIGIDNDAIREMNARIAQIARDYQIPYIDIYEPLIDTSGALSKRYTEDGIHINGEGYLMWRKTLEPFLK